MYGDGDDDEDLSAQLDAVKRELEELELENSVYEAFLQKNEGVAAALQAKEAERQRAAAVLNSPCEMIAPRVMPVGTCPLLDWSFSRIHECVVLHTALSALFI